MDFHDDQNDSSPVPAAMGGNSRAHLRNKLSCSSYTASGCVPSAITRLLPAIFLCLKVESEANILRFGKAHLSEPLSRQFGSKFIVFRGRAAAKPTETPEWQVPEPSDVRIAEESFGAAENGNQVGWRGSHVSATAL